MPQTAVRRALLFAALPLVLAACDGSATDFDPFTTDLIDLDALSQDPEALIGTWDLAASLNAETGVVTAGGSESVTFRRDGTATFDSGRGTREVTYRVERRTYANGTRDARPSLQFDGGGYGEDFGTAGDLLVLDSTPVDGPQSRYRRRQPAR